MRDDPFVPISGPEFSSDNAGDGPVNDLLQSIEELRSEATKSEDGVEGKRFQLTILSIVSSILNEMRRTKSPIGGRQSVDSILEELREEAEKSTNGMGAKKI